jgi:hypothetical protein
MKKKIGCLLVLFCCCGLSLAQQVVSSGGYVVKPDVSINWILGGSLSGISTNDQSTLNNLQKEQLMESEISIKVYPIPASDFINIEITPVDTGRLILEFYNNSGVRILNKKVVNQPVLQVNISDFPSGVYFLKVLLPQKDQLFKVEKIIKK